MNTYVTLRDLQDEEGSRHLCARLQNDGTLRIEGHDLGPGVARFFGAGMTEYEWVWLIKPPDVQTLSLALADENDILTTLKKRFSGDAAASLQTFLDENEVPYEAWSRIGD